MKIVLTAAAAAVAALVIVPVTAQASAIGQPTGNCDTYAQYKTVVVGQTVDQVQAELHMAGDPNGGVVTDPDSGFRSYAPNFPACAGPASGVLQFGIDFRANPGQPLLMINETAYYGI